MKKLSWILSLLLGLTLAAGCGGGGGGTEKKAPEKAAKNVPGGGVEAADPVEKLVRDHAGHKRPTDEQLLEMYDVTLPTMDYKWDPQAGDPTVPADMGGPGFTGEGWTTNMKIPVVGSPDARQGGQITMSIPDWPPTLRMAGKDWNTYFNYMMASMAYETLLGFDTVLMDYVPSLATHWQISEDKQTYRFRINPKARWSDGSEVTASDVVASYRLIMDPTLLEPSGPMTYGKLHEPVAISKYIVEVKVKEENWRNFYYFAGSLIIFPEKEIGKIKGSEYLDKYQFSYTANSGPYRADPKEFVDGQSLVIRRRADYWDAENLAAQHIHNIDTFKVVVVRERQLEYEMVKKGEIDFWIVPKAQWWAEEIAKLDPVKRGLLQMKKVYNNAPVGVSGIALNQTRPPLDDLKVRMALCHLLDRPTLIKKLYFDEYEPLKTHFGGVYANPDNKMIEYDEVRAVELLEEAGFKEKNAEGYRTKDGKELAFKLSYASPLSERSLTVYQEACKRAGIRITLELLTPAAAWKNLTQREYDMQDVAWGGLFIPNPETSFHSKLAEEKDNNNVTAFKNARVDELCKAYDLEYDPEKRIQIVQEIDGIVFNEHPYVLEHYNPSQRFLYWRKIRLPKVGVGRIHDDFYMPFLMWVDPELEKKVEQGKNDSAVTLEPEPVKNFWWMAWNLAQKKAIS